MQNKNGNPAISWRALTHIAANVSDAVIAKSNNHSLTQRNTRSRYSYRGNVTDTVKLTWIVSFKASAN